MPQRSRRHDQPRDIVILTFAGMQSLDAIGPYEVFSGASTALAADGRAGYRLTLVSLTGEPVTTESGLRIGTDPLLAPRAPIDTLVLPGGDGVHAARANPDLIQWVIRAAARSRRVATVCSGTFIAAQAGLLDGKTVTTHWARAQRLADEFPAIDVDADPIYRRDGDVWTSAGVTAGIDLALALVEDDHGTDVAQTVARWLVMFLHRPGGQSQFATPVWTRRAGRSTVRSAQALIESAPGDDHRIHVLAEAASMSARHFTRVFTDEVGEPPGRYVERVRVEAARRALETTSATLDVVAADCGFGTAETMRRAFHRQLGVAPDAYRRRFRVA